MTQGREGPSGDGAGNQGRNGLERHGIEPSSEVHWDLSAAGLYGTALAKQEGELTEDGAFAARTAPAKTTSRPIRVPAAPQASPAAAQVIRANTPQAEPTSPRMINGKITPMAITVYPAVCRTRPSSTARNARRLVRSR